MTGVSRSERWVCPVCKRPMLSADERCSGSFLDSDHPQNVAPMDEAAFERRWREEMREHGIPEDKITELWEAGRELGHRAAKAARESR